MTRARHVSDFNVDELRQYVTRARGSTVQRLLDEELASDRPRSGAVEALEARLEQLGGGGARDKAQRQARRAAGRARSQAQQTGRQAQQTAVEAGEGARRAAGRAQQRIGEELNKRSTQVVEQAQATAVALRRAGEALLAEGKERQARVAEQGAQKAEQLAAYLKQFDVSRALQSLEEFMRRRPAAAIGGGVALGFAASRLIKASARAEEEAGEGDEAFVEDMDEVVAEPALDVPSEEPADEATPVAEEPGRPLTPGERARALAYQRERGLGG